MTEENDMVDITSLMRNCASELSFANSYLCNKTTFSLHDSMAALELMDRKMDCCEIPATVIGAHNTDSSIMVPPRPIPKGLDDEVVPLPWDDLTIDDAADIAVEALTRLEALISGASTAESTYTCLYAHNAVLSDMKTRLDPNKNISLTEQFGSLLTNTPSTRAVGTAAQHVVYAATLTLVEASDLIRNIVLHADIYEEEDFSVNVFGLEVFPEIDDTLTPNALKTAMECLKEHQDKEASRIIGHILRFYTCFLKTCSVMAKLSASTVRNVAGEAQAQVKAGVEELLRLSALIKERDHSTNPVLKKCFDPYVYRGLVGSSPIRKISFKRPQESVPVLITIFDEVRWAVCNLLLHGTNLGRIRRLLHRISVSSVNILSRSLIILNLYFEDRLLGQYELGHLIGHEIRQLSAIPDTHLQGKLGRSFLGRLAKPMYDTLKLQVLNRNRQRAYLEAVMLPDWASLQQEAHGFDVNMRAEQSLGDGAPPYLTQYALYITVWLMDYHVALGIELRLFDGHHDFAVAYWYRDFLLSSLLNTLSSMRRLKNMAKQKAQEAEAATATSHRGKGKKKGSKTNGQNARKLVPTEDDIHDDADFMLIGLKRNLCRGINRFVAALNQAEIVSVQDYEFTTHEQRFLKRFEPFSIIAQPPPLTYHDFRQGSDFTSIAQADLLTATSDCFKSAKAMMESLKTQLSHVDKMFTPITVNEARGFERICVGNSVFLMKLTQKVRGGKGTGKVTFDFEANKQFCTIKID